MKNNKETIQSSNLPTSNLYAQAVRVGDIVYLSGTAGVNPKTNKVEGTTIQEQTRQAILNCEVILKEAGSSLEDVIRVVIFLKNSSDFDGMNEEYAKFFAKNPPARTIGKVGVERSGILVSMMMDALVSEEKGS